MFTITSKHETTLTNDDATMSVRITRQPAQPTDTRYRLLIEWDAPVYGYNPANVHASRFWDEFPVYYFHDSPQAVYAAALTVLDTYDARHQLPADVLTLSRILLREAAHQQDMKEDAARREQRNRPAYA